MLDEFRKKLIADHMEMAGAIASQCLLKYNLASLLPYDDLLAYARAGLVEAAHNYDPRSGAEFRSYSWARIRGAVLDGVRKNSRYSRSYRGDEDDTEDSLTAKPGGRTLEHGCVPVFFSSDERLSAKPTDRPLGASPETLPDGESLHYSPEAAVDAGRLRATLLRAIDALPARDRDVILRHYFRGEPIKDIAQDYGFYVQTIVRFHSRSLAQLRQALSDVQADDGKELAQ
jgi:RNA polymerase sigma factor for flagellar operon FliA